ncbi:DEAD/DEAH box helicase, partial [Kocuria sp.]|uniref:DEAD/DEAH box helicase n=1 Tax=Kocuria sp. TaxID=1871328 RepID=UPI0025C2C0B6
MTALGGQRREGQRFMAAKVAEALETGRHLLVQAGTGTGKSLAYLVPALRHARTADKPVVVATATLALQSQITGRDVPRLLDALEDELDDRPVVALLKGRSNYACLHKVEGGYPDDDGPLFDVPGSGPAAGGADRPLGGLAQQVLRLLEWVETTETGDRDDVQP